MKKLLRIAIAVNLFCYACSNNNSEQSGENISDETLVPLDTIDAETHFSLSYTSIGLGSNMGRKQPFFKADHQRYVYYLQQNSSWSGEIDDTRDTLYQGVLQKASIDSIVSIVNHTTDTLIYETNPHIMSGGCITSALKPMISP